jgi:molybdopterin molybdotransferase
MLLYKDALELLMAAARERGRRPFQTVPLKDSIGRVCSSALVGAEDLPPFDNSAMDGFAVRAASTAGASAQKPLTLPVAATLSAGDAPSDAAAGAAVEIMTGAPVPRGYDAVVRVEDVERLEGGRAIALREPAGEGDYVRRRGADFAAGGPILREGERLEPRHVLALAALGVARVPVRLRPRVAFLSTGRELVDHDRKPGPGQIRNATGPYLEAALVERLGCQLVAKASVGDDAAVFADKLEELLEQDLDMILATGGVSMGRHDYVPAVVARHGGEVLFHKTATRPGKPVLAARFGHGPLFLGLPGNPISTVVALRFFGEPILRWWLGMPDEKPRLLRLAAAVEKPAGLRCFFKAKLEEFEVRVLEGQASFQIRPLLDADCWAVLPEEGTRLEAGARVEVYPI